ncbi:helix-turn-helix transcriptional regulator [Leuconostoc palmae]|uniref:helix-turn-helix transcriptional regulator n=1 Tax=Leuconostoc palmae TaxID=501487 RepID=UPI001C7CD034|nr:helix-turn-helix transcriptional regulator [Leuconostoc palmae]
MTVMLPQQLKKLRLQHNLSQEDIASKLFVSRQAVSRWESGDATPDLTNLVKLSEILETSLDNLVLGLENQTSLDQESKKIDPTEFVFDPTKNEYVHRHHPMTFWNFCADYWWLIFPIGGFLSWFIPKIVESFK